MEHSSVLRITRERLSELGLAQIPQPAITFLVAKLATQVRGMAARSITTRTVARAILTTAPTTKTGSQPVTKLSNEPKPDRA